MSAQSWQSASLEVAPAEITTYASPPEASQPYGNAAAGASIPGLSATDPGSEGDLVPHARQQLTDHAQAVGGLTSTLPHLPQDLRGRAASLCQQTSLTARMLADDVAELGGVDPEEGGALTEEVDALLAELVDGTLLVDAYRMLAEETLRLRMSLLSPALVKLFGAPLVVQPALAEYNTLLHQSFEAASGIRGAVRECGEAALQMVVQQGVSFLMDAAMAAYPPSTVVLVIGDTLIGNAIDDALGSPRSTLALDLAGKANQLSGDTDMAKALGDFLGLGESLLGDDVLGKIGFAVDLVDALAEMGDAGLRAAGALQEMQALTLRVRAARAVLGDTVARIDEILAPVVQGLLKSAADATFDVSEAAGLVDRTEAELGPLF